MKKWMKILIGIIATPILLIAILFVTYIIMNSQGVIEPFQIGNPNAETKILIASQGSEFKESLVDTIVTEFKDSNIYFSVLDCTALANEKKEDWDAIIIIHTMQIHKMPAEAKTFLDNVDDFSDIILVSTSGGGDDFVTDFDVDAISSASRLNKIPPIMKWIGEKLNKKLSQDNIANSAR